MSVRLALALALTGAVALTHPALAAGAADEPARQLAKAIERRADKTSFADLDRFGEEASHAPGREALRRLEHVSTILLNQSEFDRFDRWNALLAAKAGAENDHRYAVMAEIDALKSRFDRGDASVRPQLRMIADSEPDWFARAHATDLEGQLLIEDGQVGEALRRLFAARELIPLSDPDAGAAESEVWGTVGIALMQLSDLEGAAKAFAKSDFELADRGYPRPDFDNVYNMVHLAVQLGDADLARDLAATHHRLAVRSDLPHLDAWDKNLCAMVADSFGSPREVIACLAGLDARLSGAEFLAPRLLTFRAVAEARLGDVAAASADLARLRAIEASRAFPAASFDNEPRIAAELLSA